MVPKSRYATPRNGPAPDVLSMLLLCFVFQFESQERKNRGREEGNFELLVVSQALKSEVRPAPWCARRDSNPHDFTHCHLKAARLPIPPRALGKTGLRPGWINGVDVTNQCWRDKACDHPCRQVWGPFPRGIFARRDRARSDDSAQGTGWPRKPRPGPATASCQDRRPPRNRSSGCPASAAASA